MVKTKVASYLFDAATPALSAPDLFLEANRYHVTLAQTPAQLDAALRMRFEVFNLELNEGLESSYETERDVDDFDPYCFHLIVVENKTGDVVGTYRFQTHEMAMIGPGYYAQQEFTVSDLPASMLQNSLEVGRACIAKDHRNTKVLYLLWRGLARFMEMSGKRYLFGCCSLTSQDPIEGYALMQQLHERGHVDTENRVDPQPEYQCYDDSMSVEKTPTVKVPKLFRIYLDYGAKVLGEPAIDRQFKTIDYLVVLDTEAMSPRSRSMFF